MSNESYRTCTDFLVWLKDEDSLDFGYLVVLKVNSPFPIPVILAIVFDFLGGPKFGFNTLAVTSDAAAAQRFS